MTLNKQQYEDSPGNVNGNEVTRGQDELRNYDTTGPKYYHIQDPTKYMQSGSTESLNNRAYKENLIH